MFIQVYICKVCHSRNNADEASSNGYQCTFCDGDLEMIVEEN